MTRSGGQDRPLPLRRARLGGHSLSRRPIAHSWTAWTGPHVIPPGGAQRPGLQGLEPAPTGQRERGWAWSRNGVEWSAQFAPLCGPRGTSRPGRDPRERVRELGRGRFLVGPALGQHWTNRAPAGCCLLAQSGHVGSPQTAHLGTLCTRRLAVAPPSAEPGSGTVRPRWGHRRGDAADKLAWCASGSRASDRPDCLKPSPLGLAVPRPRSVAHRCRDSGGMLRRPARRQRFWSVGEDGR